MDKEIIYLDYNATTPVSNAVAEAMKPWISDVFGNPSSHYSMGVEAKKAIEKARSQVASLIGASADEIVFTSGGTEANNFALKGIAFAHKHKGNHIITTAVEHPAVLDVCKWLGNNGFDITILPVDKKGSVQISEFEKAIKPSTILASVMHSNNETGVMQPIRELSAIAHSRGIVFHTDAAQSVGKVALDVRELGVDLLSLAGHKLYAPKGVGALYIKTGVVIEQLLHGASQERGLRAGTENVIQIVGLGKASEIITNNLSEYEAHFRRNRDLLLTLLKSKIPDIHLNTDPENSLPNTLSISFRNVQASTILTELHDIAASAGAACHPSGNTISHVLQAMKVPIEYAAGTIRFSVGRNTTEAEIRIAADRIAEVFKKLNLSDAYHEKVEPEAEKIRLTQFTHGLGCACKLRPSMLEDILMKMQIATHPDLLVGTETSDDAAVYRINDTEALVQTVDFFSPIVDDPYCFGAIAAANALSDVYAMGAVPLFALNLVGFPVSRLPQEVLHSIMKGASDKLAEAGVIIAGGHTIESTEPLFGMTVSGMIKPDQIWRNTGIQMGDNLILTKPLGTGIITTALKNGLAEDEIVKMAENSMKQLNKTAAEVFRKYSIHACTDVTGFGFLGHLSEMVVGSKVEVEIYANHLPVLPGVEELVRQGAVPGGTLGNLEHYSENVRWVDNISPTMKIIYADAQTSGGLLAAVPASEAKALLDELLKNGLHYAGIVGKCIGSDNTAINFI